MKTDHLNYEPYYKCVLIDCGRGYFPPDQIMTIIKEMAACDYKYLFLGFGNDGLRFLPDDMTLEANGTTYDSNLIREAIIRENDLLAPKAMGQWSGEEMDAIIDYACQEGIEIIPMIDNPGHATSITQAMIACGIKDALLPSRNNSADTGSRSFNISNPKAVSWARALLKKYIAYFAGKSCHNFNLAMDEYAGCAAGWDSLSEKEKEDMIVYTHLVCEDVTEAGMNPIAFCDVVGHSGDLPEKLIGINWNGTFLKGHRNLNANYNWYYVLGAEGDPSWCGYEKAMRCAAEIPADCPVKTNTAEISAVDPAGEKVSEKSIRLPETSDATGAGCVFAVWNDSYLPSEAYIPKIISILKKLAERNPEYFRIIKP